MSKIKEAAKRGALLTQFANRIQTQLECFVKEENLLLPGQRVVFSVRFESVPVVIPGTIEVIPELGMRMLDFFTAKRFQDIGFKKAMASRLAYAIRNYGMYPESRIETATVHDFIEANRKRLESQHGGLFINAGAKCKRAVLLALADVGLWDRGSFD